MTSQEPVTLGTGNQTRIREGCNHGVGDDGLDILSLHADGTRTEYISNRGHIMDIYMSARNFKKAFQEGMDNTKAIVKKHKFHNDHDSLNWSDVPCSLRMSYDAKDGRFNVHIWNELLQVQTHLSLTREDILKVLVG
jgi:hypothetical protein